MAVYLFAHIELKPGVFPRFAEAMAEVQARAELAGWKLFAAFVNRTGALNTVTDIWELESFAHLDAGFATIAGHPRFAEIQTALGETIARETLTFADRIEYPTPKG